MSETKRYLSELSWALMRFPSSMDNVAGDAVLKLADSGSITIDCISKAQLKYYDFVII